MKAKPIQIQAKADCKNSQWQNFDKHVGKVGLLSALIWHAWALLTSDWGSVYYDDNGVQHSRGTMVIYR